MQRNLEDKIKIRKDSFCFGIPFGFLRAAHSCYGSHKAKEAAVPDISTVRQSRREDALCPSTRDRDR